MQSEEFTRDQLIKMLEEDRFIEKYVFVTDPFDGRNLVIVRYIYIWCYFCLCKK